MVVLLGGPGACNQCPALKEHDDRRFMSGVVCHSVKMDCVPASIVNGVMRLLGGDAARLAKFRMQAISVQFRNLKMAHPVVHPYDQPAREANDTVVT